MCFSNVYFSAPCSLLAPGGGRLLVAEAAVDILMHVHGRNPPTPPLFRAPLLLEASSTEPRQANGRLGRRDHHRHKHVSQKVWDKTRHVQFVNYCTAWLILIVDGICFVLRFFQHGTNNGIQSQQM